MATKLRNIPPRLQSVETRTAIPAAKRADAELLTSEHRAWRRAVMERAGWQCEAVDHSVRCDRRSPAHRLIADHIAERKDGGALADPANGRALCLHHHGLKTMQARAARMARLT